MKPGNRLYLGIILLILILSSKVFPQNVEEANSLFNEGVQLYNKSRFDDALPKFIRAAEIYLKLGPDLSLYREYSLSWAGISCHGMGQYGSALEYYEKALVIAEKIAAVDETARLLSSIGSVFYALTDYEKARNLFEQALAVFEQTGQTREVATVLNNIGVAYYDENKFQKAAEYLTKSIEKKEALRLTAEGEIRRDYLASQISTYRWIVSAYVNDDKPEAAFDAAELSSAKYLVEQMGERLNESIFHFSGIAAYHKKIDRSEAVINFINIEWYSPDETRSSKLIVDAVVATKDTVDAVEIDKEDFIRSVSMDHRKVLAQTPAGLRGFSITVNENFPEVETEQWDFSGIVNTYRHLLSKPYLTRIEEETLDDLSRKLFNLLISPIEKYIEGKSDLLIIPEGILAYLPFETLLMPDGRYLIEKYNIRYTQSLTVSEMIERRSGHLSGADGYPILAFGGAVYNTQSYQTDMLVSERHFDTFKEETLAAMERGMSSRSAYETLGLGGWTNLPGTLIEVKALGNIIKGGSVFTGADVNEAFIKKMSREGKLKQYRILHFATHGIVVPDFPELSAIVLSLNLSDKNGDDGYLTMAEIANLDLNAEFVNLSACETGLGSLYSGEGVVGLTQAFLVAGAGGLSVSLWQVADESTMQFMIGLYKLVQDRGLSYHKAMSEMKRSFIKEGKFSRPFFWAPFVYYGN